MRHLVIALFTLASIGVAAADEAPIAGTVKAVDTVARILTVEAPGKGKSRVVVIEIRAESKIIRSRRSTDPGRPGFVEQAVHLEDIRPGWTVSVTTKHDGEREVAEVVKVLVERRAP